MPDEQFKLEDYSADQLKACESVLLELSRVLGAYWQDIALVGGWVPKLLANDEEEPHVGTVDIDLAFNYLTIPETAYAKIHELLVKHNYVQNTHKAKQFQYFRTVKVGTVDRVVILDLLMGEYDQTRAKRHRHGKLQDAAPLRAKGVDMVFQHLEEIPIDGELPDRGGKYATKIKVASVAPIIVMKCAAMEGRFKTKDSYDLYYFIKHYRGGGQAVLEELKPDIKHGSVTKALAVIRERYQSPEHVGPVDVAKFREIEDEAEAAVLQQDVYQTMLAFLEGVDKLLAETASLSGFDS